MNCNIGGDRWRVIYGTFLPNLFLKFSFFPVSIYLFCLYFLFLLFSILSCIFALIVQCMISFFVLDTCVVSFCYFSLFFPMSKHRDMNTYWSLEVKPKSTLPARSKWNISSSLKISLPLYKAIDTELVGGFENSITIQFISLFNYVLM